MCQGCWSNSPIRVVKFADTSGQIRRFPQIFEVIYLLQILKCLVKIDKTINLEKMTLPIILPILYAIFI